MTQERPHSTETVPLETGEWFYGELTRQFAEEVQRSAIENLDQRRLTMIKRGM